MEDESKCCGHFLHFRKFVHIFVSLNFSWRLIYIFGFETHFHTHTITNTKTYLNVYCLKHRILLTFNRTIHALFIVNLSSYICIRTMESTYPDLQGRRQLLLEGRRLKPSQISNKDCLRYVHRQNLDFCKLSCNYQTLTGSGSAPSSWGMSADSGIWTQNYRNIIQLGTIGFIAFII